MNTTTNVLSAFDLDVEGVINHKNWTGLSLRELVAAGRISDVDAVLNFAQTPIDEALDRAVTRILEGTSRDFLNWAKEARPLYDHVEHLKSMVLNSLGIPRRVHVCFPSSKGLVLHRNGEEILNWPSGNDDRFLRLVSNRGELIVEYRMGNEWVFMKDLGPFYGVEMDGTPLDHIFLIENPVFTKA